MLVSTRNVRSDCLANVNDIIKSVDRSNIDPSLFSQSVAHNNVSYWA